MDKARRREEIYNRDKGEELFVEAQELVHEALSLYHKDWPVAIGNLQLASSKLQKAKPHFTKAGLDSSRLKDMTPGARRVHARDIMDILQDESLTFLSEPKLPEVCVTDFLDRSAPIRELEFRLESELEKAKARSDGDAQVNSAQRAIEQGSKDQRVGRFASARKNFASAEDLIEKAQAAFDSIKTSSPELEARWTEACNQVDECPMLTRERQMELEQALRAREKPDMWAPRNWTPIFGMDMPTMYCLCTVEVGISFEDINNLFSFEHSEDGLRYDGRDTEGIMTNLRELLKKALKEQEEDMAFKAFAICAVPELYAARESVVNLAEEDRVRAEKEADVHQAKPMDLLPPMKIVWDDLPPHKLGPIAVSDEVNELHMCAKMGNVERMRWLLEECSAQHYMAVNDKHKPYKTTFEAPVSPDALDYDGKTPLFKSAKYNQYFTASLLLEKQANVSATDLNGETPLHIAAGNGASEMIKLLLKHGANVEAANMHGENPVHFCARYSLGDIDCARSLVNTGVDLNLTDHRQRTLLHHLVVNRRYGNKELYMLQFFLVMGADADSRDAEGKTALDLCDDPQARAVLQKAYHEQGELRIERWGHTGLPPLLVNAPVGLHDQQMAITMGVPLMCVMHKGQVIWDFTPHASSCVTPVERRVCAVCSQCLRAAGPACRGMAIV